MMAPLREGADLTFSPIGESTVRTPSAGVTAIVVEVVELEELEELRELEELEVDAGGAAVVAVVTGGAPLRPPDPQPATNKSAENISAVVELVSRGALFGNSCCPTPLCYGAPPLGHLFMDRPSGGSYR